MAATGTTLECPKGHLSTEPDYCSECGARMAGLSAVGTPSTDVAAGQICPDCGTAREQPGIAYCEVCGFNFQTGAHGDQVLLQNVASVAHEAELAPPVPDAETEAAPASVSPPAIFWRVVVSLDPLRRGPEDPEPPEGVQTFTVELTQPVLLIGREDQARGIHPEIALPFDEAVSRRHALLQVDAVAGLTLRDIGAANGTRLNGRDLEPMKDHAVAAGDVITLGRWSRIVVEAE